MSSEINAAPVARQISMNMVMQSVLQNGPISRADLAKVTGLSKQTTSDVVRELESGGWLRERGRTIGKIGRSAVTYEINAGAAFVAAVDLGGTKVSAAIGDLLGTIIAEDLQPTDTRGGTDLVQQVADIVQNLALSHNLKLADLKLVVLGTPGVFQAETGRIDIAPNVPHFDAIDVRGLLSQHLGVPVFVENDVNLAAKGEQWRGHGAGLSTFAFIALGTGVGMGIIADGQLLRGARGAAGEISYLPFGGDPYDPRGFALGTLEYAVGSVGIAQRFAGFGGRPGTSVREIFAMLETGDPAAKATIEETARLIAPAIAAVGAILDPEVVILGGSIGIREELVAEIRKMLVRCTPYPTRIEMSVLGSRAALVGALGVAVSKLHDELFGVTLIPGTFSLPSVGSN